MLGSEGIETEIMAMEDSVTQITGQGTQYIRPPYGEYNADVKTVVEGLGFQALVMWDIDTRDWSGRPADYMVSVRFWIKRNGVQSCFFTCMAPILWKLYGNLFRSC